MLDARKHYLVRNSFLAKMCFKTIKPDACLGDTDYVLLVVSPKWMNTSGMVGMVGGKSKISTADEMVQLHRPLSHRPLSHRPLKTNVR